MSRSGKRVRTTIADNNAARPADRVNRDFTAGRPNQLWVYDNASAETINGLYKVERRSCRVGNVERGRSVQ